MGIFNTLSEIVKNNDKFAQWEENKNDTQAQRDELNRRREHKQQEIKAAQDLGKSIIDVVDIMDQHSEDIAENVETVTEPLVGLAPFLGGGLALFLSAKFLGKPAIEKNQKIHKDFINSEEVNKLVEAIENAQKPKIPDNISIEEKIKLNNEYFENRVYFSKYDICYKESINRLKKTLPEYAIKAEELHKKYKKAISGQLNKIKLAAAIPAVTAIASFILTSIYTTKLQVESSRVARYQARKILEDPKYFVNYTPEQIAQAEQTLKNDPEYKKSKKKTHTDKLKGGIIKGLASIIKDNKEYRNWKKTDKDESKKIDRQLTQEEIIQAKKDKEVIQRVVRDINNRAEKYSENMEVAANVILGTTPFLGLGIGAIVSNVMNRLKIIPNFVDKIVKTQGSQKAQDAYEKMKTIKEGKPGFKAARRKFITAFLYDEIDSKSLSTAEQTARKEASQLNHAVRQAKKGLAIAMTMKAPRRLVFGAIGGAITTLAGSLIALKLQKASSRAGRYIAKRELEQDPKNFIGYTEEDFEQVKDIKAPKQTLGQKIKDYALFIPRIIKDYIDYQHFKQHEMKKDKMLKEELTKLEITPQQLQDAKNLQRKIFNTFEKVDDKSQEYSESTEAAIEIAQPFVQGLGLLTLASPMIYAGYLARKGKLSAKSIINKVLTVLSTSSKITESKYFKNYLNEIAEQMPYKVQNTTASTTLWSNLLDGINIKETPAHVIIKKFAQNSSKYLKKFTTLSETEQNAILRDLEEMFPYDSSFRKHINEFIYMDKQLRSNILSFATTPQNLGKIISEMPAQQYDILRYKLTSLLNLKSSIAEETIYAITNLPQKEFGQFIDLAINKETLTKISKMTDNEYNSYINQIINPLIKHCKENSIIYEYGCSSSAATYKLGLFKGLTGLFSAVKALDKNDFKLMDQLFNNKSDFLKNISKIEDTDFERIKNYVLSLKELLPEEKMLPPQVTELFDFVANATKDDIQKYANKFLAVKKQVQEAKKLTKEQFEKEILPKIKEQFAKHKIEGFENINTKEEFLVIAEQFLKKGINFAKENNVPNIITNYLEKNSARIVSNPKNIIADMKNIKTTDLLDYWESKISAKSDKEIAQILNKLEMRNNIASRLRVANMDKDYLLDCIKKLKIVLQKLPDKEIKNILNSMLKEFNEHPDEFITYVRTGKILDIYQTPGLKKAALAAGISWTALNVIVTYTIEAILADIQLKSGRLGVMKALDSLDDPAYYADVEKTAGTAPAEPVSAQPSQNNKVWDMFINQA